MGRFLRGLGRSNRKKNKWQVLQTMQHLPFFCVHGYPKGKNHKNGWVSGIQAKGKDNPLLKDKYNPVKITKKT